MQAAGRFLILNKEVLYGLGIHYRYNLTRTHLHGCTRIVPPNAAISANWIRSVILLEDGAARRSPLHALLNEDPWEGFAS
jgi:hypothetical protein